MALMHIRVKYHNMLRRRTGVEQETLDVPSGSSLQVPLEHIAQRYGPSLREMLFAPDGTVATHLVVFHNGQLARHDPLAVHLAEGDELLLFPSISGG